VLERLSDLDGSQLVRRRVRLRREHKAPEAPRNAVSVPDVGPLTWIGHS
jgi:hypothetical protein